MMADAEGTVDLYAEFGVSRDASPTTLKKAYHRLCLKYHPDKLRQLDSDTDKAAASAAFQRITHWHHVLQDPDRRARYDETGFVGTVGGTDEENGIDIRPPDQGWDAFFRELWGGLITVDKIESFKLRYRGSDAERADVIDFYLKFKGNMGKVLESVPTCTWEDEERFRGLVQTALDAGDLTERHDAFFKVDERATERRRKQAEKEEKTVAKMEGAKKRKAALAAAAAAVSPGVKTKEKGQKLDEEEDGDVDLEALREDIKKQAKKRMDGLLDKWEKVAEAEEAASNSSKKSGNKKRGVKSAEPSEEEFQALQHKLFRGKSDGAGPSSRSNGEREESPAVDELEWEEEVEEAIKPKKPKRVRKT